VKKAEDAMQHHPVVSQDEWLAARKALLAREKEFTRARDALSAERRAMPWVKVEKNYAFDTPQGRRSLADLFAGKSQLVIYHFMLGPGWIQGCPSCSYLADHFDGMTIHLAQRDVTFMAVSRAPLSEIEAYKKRMAWRFPWVSSFGGDFNRDFAVSFSKEDAAAKSLSYNYETVPVHAEELPGLSTFYKNERGEVFHTYSTYARGLDILVGTYNVLDMAPKGRDENALPWTMAWVRRHDEYEAAQPSCCGGKT
jgi:predicted dithiol-disulfide oxidoreductase (DUF899 family)